MNKEQLKELDRIAGELKALRDDVENTDIPVEVTSTTEQDKWQRVIDEQPWKQLIKHVERLDDTVTRLALEVAKLQENEDEPTCNDGGIPIPIHRKK